MDTKNIIISLLILMLVGLGYLYLRDIPSSTGYIAMKERCRKVGSEVHQGIVDEYKNNDPDTTLLRAEYVYSTELDTCLYTSGAISVGQTGNTIVQNWIMDSYTNQELFSYSAVNGEDFGGLSAEEFDRQKAILFENR